MSYVDTAFQSPTVLSLCTALYRLDTGLERGIAALRNYYYGGERWTHERIVKYAAYVEIEAIAAYNLVRQMEQGVLAPAPVWTDLKTFPWEQFYGKVHIITGGYPCQPFSQAGLQNGVVDPRHLFPFIEHGIDAVRPVLCWFENVANHLNIGYDEVRRRISSLGYKVEADIFSAQQVGAPHLRKRLFILAVADSYCTEQSKRRGDLTEVLGISERKSQSEHSAALSGGDGENVANTDEQRLQESGQTRVGEFQKKTGEGVDDRPEQCSGDVDNSFQSGLEGQRRNGNAKKRWEESVRSIASSSIWPAGQGTNQHSWEAPRLESTMGSTVDGYDFTEDLLRLLGNSVVEQTAELAFRTLIQKFL